MSDEREYWRSAIVGRVNEQQPIYAGELLDELADLRAQLARANERIEALEAELAKIAAGEVWRHITSVCVCRWCSQSGEQGGIKHLRMVPNRDSKEGAGGKQVKTRKGEPVIVVPEEQQQIVELERQLAEANTRIETLTRRLEAAEERAEAWEEAALGKTGKQSFDEMERSWRETVVRAEEGEGERAEELRATIRALEQSVDTLLRERQQAETERNRLARLLHDLTPLGSEFVDNPDRCAEWIREAIADLRIISAAERERGDHYRNACIQTEREVQQTLGYALGYPWCKDDQMAFPGSTEADGVFVGEHTAETLAMEAAKRIGELEDERKLLIKDFRNRCERVIEVRRERDELQRKLDACQCETRVLNESLLIEAKQERDQLAAEAARLRAALKKTIIYGGWDNYDKGTLWCICTCCKADGGYTQEEYDQKDYLVVQHIKGCEAVAALASTPHAAKAAERVKATTDVVRATRELTANFESRTYRSPHHGDGWEAIKHEVQLREQLRKALDRLDALDKTEVHE